MPERHVPDRGIKASPDESSGRSVMVAKGQGVLGDFDTGQVNDLIVRLEEKYRERSFVAPPVIGQVGREAPALFKLPPIRKKFKLDQNPTVKGIEDNMAWAEFPDEQVQPARVDDMDVWTDVMTSGRNPAVKVENDLGIPGEAPSEVGQVRTEGHYRIVGKRKKVDELEDEKIADTETKITHTPRQRRRLEHQANRMARRVYEMTEAAAAKAEDATKKVPDIESDAKISTDENGGYRIVDGQVINKSRDSELIKPRKLATLKSKAKVAVEKTVPILKIIAARIPNDIVPKSQTSTQKAVSGALTFMSGVVALGAPMAAERVSSANAARPSERPPAVTAQAFGDTSQAQSLDLQVLDILKNEADKPYVQQKGKLEYPKNLGKENGLGYVQLPENPLLYRFFNLQDFGEFGPGNGETCPAQRFGQKDLIGVIHTTALSWHSAHPDIRLMIADENADGHASHMNGVDFDVYTENDSLRINSPQFKRQQAIELGKIMLNSGKIKIMFYNDREVMDILNQYAKDNKLSGEVEYAKNHDAHFHVRINAEPGPVSAPSCETQSDAKIDIAWMPPSVRKWDDRILKYVKAYNMDPEFASIIMYKESKGNENAVSWVGALGLMQIMPETGKSIARELGIKDYDLTDPDTNIKFGVYHLSQLLKQFGKPEHGPSWDTSILLAAIGYNGGEGASRAFLKREVIKGQGPFCESREYGYYVRGMWRDRRKETSKSFEELNSIGHRCNDNANSYPIASLNEA